MKYYRTTLTPQEHELLSTHIENLISRAKQDINKFLDTGAVLESILIQLRDAEEVVVKEEKVKNTYVPNLCKEHPNYEAKRAPTIDCDGHWEAYKRLNPTKYEAARRKFERKLNDSKQAQD